MLHLKFLSFIHVDINSEAILGHTVALNWSTLTMPLYTTNLRARSVTGKVTVVLNTANTHTLRSGGHTRPRYSEGADSITMQLDFNTFVHF